MILISQLDEPAETDYAREKQLKDSADAWSRAQNNIRRLSKLSQNYFDGSAKPQLVKVFLGGKKDDYKIGFDHPVYMDGKSYLQKYKVDGGIDLSRLIVGAKPNSFVWLKVFGKTIKHKDEELSKMIEERKQLLKVLPFFMRKKKKGTETYRLIRFDGTSSILHYQTDGYKIAERFKLLTKLIIERSNQSKRSTLSQL